MDLAYPSARDVAVAVLHKIERRLQEYDVQNGTDHASRWLKSLDVENNQMKPATHRLAAELASYFSNGYENSLPASITGTYMLDLREEVDPDNGAGDNPDVNPGTKPATPTQPSKPVHPAPPIHGQHVNKKGKAKNSNVRPHAGAKPIRRDAALHAQALPAGQHVDKQGQIINAKGQVVGHLERNNQTHLPQTGEKATSLAWLGLGLASLTVLIGLAGERRKR